MKGKVYRSCMRNCLSHTYERPGQCQWKIWSSCTELNWIQWGGYVTSHRTKRKTAELSNLLGFSLVNDKEGWIEMVSICGVQRCWLTDWVIHRMMKKVDGTGWGTFNDDWRESVQQDMKSLDCLEVIWNKWRKEMQEHPANPVLSG